VEQTIIGHLHTRLILWKSRVLSGIPPIRFLDRNVSRFSSALHEAHHWWPFRVRLCPALSGTELLNDGGYYTVQIDPTANQPARIHLSPAATVTPLGLVIRLSPINMNLVAVRGRTRNVRSHLQHPRIFWIHLRIRSNPKTGG
jgi:hypothetical protein